MVSLTIQTARADEGQWQPYQLPQLKAELKRIGIAIPAEQLANLSKLPMSAMVALPGCSASFVSDAGLIVTNHHCAYGAVQRNSSATRNLIADGFLAKTRAEELPAGPSERIYVTDKVETVTDKVTGNLSPNLSGLERNKQIQNRIKGLIAECEQDKAYRCSVPSFHRGLEYYRIRQLMIRDVRLVYAPSDKIGNFGGDVDNFEWPRHTGDFSFMRAYVGKDGRPADPSPDNIPYHSKDFLKVSAEGLKNGDPILLAGYPGRTSRYKLPTEIRSARDTSYPRRVAENQADLATIALATKDDPESTVRYASVVKSINNGMKKTEGLIDGFARKDIAAIKDVQESEFRQWFATHGDTNDKNLLAELDKVIADDITLGEQEFAMSVALHSDMFRSARSLYRLAQERKKSDAEREPGFQERDIPFLKGRLSGLERSFVSSVDQARWQAALQRYAQMPADTHPQGLDALLPAVDAIAPLYAQTKLTTTAQRLAWLDKDVDSMTQSDDAFLRLASKVYQLGQTMENRRKEIDGNLERIIPRYMQAFINWKKSQGKPVYPDANSTLRVTFGTVAPYSPRDGISKGPFTTVEGIVEKNTGKEPFNVPPAEQEAIKAKRYGVFRDPVLGTVPVNFLSSADTTGGNSGSAVMNKHGDLIGLNFDSTYESITKDWYFDSAITRAIHVDIRYMLWVMKEIDHADNLLQEMTIKYPSHQK
ncbi:S46 family peptidase [Undibacterium sp. RTI2.1]|uniref:S46 family peptidase n=1 Tax=unclassified Undibacterium TaxID=2630295 RepID=UPI002AB33D6E|nr:MULTISPECIES: S46 family peptidase [unclassified Undibacterium]MDY7536984.1 S46 family peptidase [Undibacterium sp. 5I1]MEB0030479.1 S46 family peptidase [Undibacterium sp. RTI2.1]MEB0115263.1 S46 family peptidase [Undibacterium sp. RTI2.2]MEB0231336.1 S46 family peptidase [Undibacterium sp. 10I3]MEB0258749.1 S46 family peptidase [Undibacterium sp. 5I1]